MKKTSTKDVKLLTKKEIKSEFVEVDIEFEVFSKRRVKAVVPREMSVYEFEQMFLHKLNLPPKEKREATVARINDRILECYKKQLQKMSEIKDKKLRLKMNLDSVISTLIDFDYSNYTGLDEKKTANDGEHHNKEVSLLNSGNTGNNFLGDCFFPCLPNSSLKPNLENLFQRGMVIVTENVTFNGRNFNLSSFNFKEFFKLGFNPRNLISFSPNISHKKCLKPVAKIVDVELSEHFGEILYKHLYPELNEELQNTLERKILNDEGDEDLPDSQKWEIIYNIVDILDYLHDNHTIHGNLTPFNVVLQSLESVFLIDFGLSGSWRLEKYIEEEKDRLYTRNLAYCPPEFFSGKLQYLTQFMPFSDVWSLGCLIYFIFCKKHPWLVSFFSGGHKDLKKYMDTAFKNDEIFYLNEREIDPNALFLIEECCKLNYEKRITVKQIKMFIVLIANKSCPQLLQKLIEAYPNAKEELTSNEQFISTNTTTVYNEKNYKIFHSKVLIEGLLENFERNDMDVKLDFSNEGLGNEKLIFLGNFFSYLNQVKCIDLRSNSITLEGIEGIISLYNNFRTKLQKFYLDKNPIDHASFQRFAEVVTPTNSYIKVLSLVGCSTQKSDIIPLLNILSKFAQLESLDLSTNFIGDYELTLICQHFRYVKNLKSLVLADNLITGKGIQSFIENAKHLAHLKFFSLDLSYNKLGAEGFKDFAHLITSVMQMHTINLEGNNAGDEGVVAMFNHMIDKAVSLKKATQIEFFNLKSNDFSDEAGNKIISFYSILRNHHIKNGIINLSIDHNALTAIIEKKILELNNSLQNQVYKQSLNDNQKDIDNSVKYINECLTKKCPEINVSHFKIVQKLLLKNGVKEKKNIFINTYKITEIDTTLFRELSLAESYYNSQRNVKFSFVKEQKEIDFYPHLGRGDKFLPLERLKSSDGKGEFVGIEHTAGEILIITFFHNLPSCIAMLKDLNDMLIIRQSRLNATIKVKAVFFGDQSELDELENKKNFQEFEFFVIDQTGEEAFAYSKLFFKEDIKDPMFQGYSEPPVIVVNKYGTIAAAGTLSLDELYECLCILVACDRDVVYSKSKKRKEMGDSQIGEIEVSNIDQIVLKKIRRNISYFQKTLAGNVKDYNYLFEYLENRDIIVGQALDVVGHKTKKIKIKYFVRNPELMAIEKFLKTKINKILPLDIFKIEKKLLKTVDFSLGDDCSHCKCGKEKLFSFYGQYYCHWCKLYFCEECGDHFDKSKKGLKKLIHPHNLVYLLNKSSDFTYMRNVDEYKLGNKQNIEESKSVEKEEELFSISHFVICDFCDDQFDQNFRFICLNCRPGYAEINLVDFCPKCFDFFREKGKHASLDKEVSEESLEIRNQHDIKGHIYVKVIASFGNYMKF